MTHGVGFSDTRLARRRGFLENLPSNPDLFLENQVHGLVIGDEETGLRALAEHVEAQGRAATRMRIGALEIFELLRPAD